MWLLCKAARFEENSYWEGIFIVSFLKGVVEFIVLSLFLYSYFSCVDKSYVLILKVVKRRCVDLQKKEE